jgi:uncharacterized OB-fold protein
MTAPGGDRNGAAAIDESAPEGLRHVAGRVTLVGSKCPDCGDVRYPPRALCPMDRTPAQRVALSGRGIIYECVRVMLAPNGFEAPYWVGYVDLDDGVRVFARISDELGQPTHGDRVALTFAPVSNRSDAKRAPLFRPESVGD